MEQCGTDGSIQIVVWKFENVRELLRIFKNNAYSAIDEEKKIVYDKRTVKEVAVFWKDGRKQ